MRIQCPICQYEFKMQVGSDGFFCSNCRHKECPACIAGIGFDGKTCSLCRGSGVVTDEMYKDYHNR